jgi:thiol-disulfide isomerase/thioredoxin
MEGKDLLIDFTGSDWCGWCIRLQKEVFALEAFKRVAPKKFVLVEIDFPQGKKLPVELQQQNERLQKEFGVEGFPTILLADPQGRPYARTGYHEGGVEGYLKHLEELQSGRLTRDENWKRAEAAQGLEKAQFLSAGLKALDVDIAAQHYKAVIEEIKVLDPKDETGTAAVFGFKAELAGFGGEMEKLAAKGDASVLKPAAEKFLLEHPNALPAQRQELWMSLLRFYQPPKDNDTVLKLMREVESIDPSSPVGLQAGQIAKRVAEMLAEAASGGVKK